MIRGNKVHDGVDVGILISDESVCEIIENDISCNGNGTHLVTHQSPARRHYVMQVPQNAIPQDGPKFRSKPGPILECGATRSITERTAEYS